MEFVPKKIYLPDKCEVQLVKCSIQFDISLGFRGQLIFPVSTKIKITSSHYISEVAKLFMQSANSSTNPCRMRHKCRAGVANLFSPCAKIFRHANIHSFSLLSNV